MLLHHVCNLHSQRRSHFRTTYNTQKAIALFIISNWYRVEVLWSRVEVLRNRVEVLWSCVEVLRRRVEVLRSRVEVLRNRVEVLRSRVEVLRSRVEVLRSCVEVLRNRFEVLWSRFEVLQSRVEVLCCWIFPNLTRLTVNAIALTEKISQAMPQAKSTTNVLIINHLPLFPHFLPSALYLEIIAEMPVALTQIHIQIL
ncbi:hypothetical protein [Calothrix sp. NIES-2098]|uniref:hypothetical protein n=1 Tax=Calothrix sp. NIES-2098 TaxID=1954171 RepID=UPI000B5FBD60|nr:hypothetical protein NIES2098_16160 [Calothrix sp. NIES-2098]